MPNPICSFPDCGKPLKAHGLCGGHEDQRYHGRPLTPIVRGRRAQFWAKVDKTGSDSGCWIWIGARNAYAYGVFRGPAGRNVLAHRHLYEDFGNQPLPPSLHLDHRCHQHACINPEHLRPVTVEQNAQNRSGPQANNRSGFLGVHWITSEKTWVARVQFKGRSHYAGRHSDPESANAAVTALRLRLFTHNDVDRGVAIRPK